MKKLLKGIMSKVMESGLLPKIGDAIIGSEVGSDRSQGARTAQGKGGQAGGGGSGGKGGRSGGKGCSDSR